MVIGVLLAQGRRTASRWFAAAGVTDDWQDHDYFLGSLGRKTGEVATEPLLIAIRWIPQTHVGAHVRLASTTLRPNAMARNRALRGIVWVLDG